MPRLAVILVALTAILSHGWVLDLPFKLDDVAQIPRADDKLRDELGAIVPAAANPDAVIYEHDRFRFRPLLWSLFLAELALTGEPAYPGLFHATSLLIHVVASLLLLLILRRVMSLGAAAAGAGLFALNAPGTQAVSWIAARPDLMVTAAGLGALLVALGGASRVSKGRAVAVGLLLAVSVLSKVSGLVIVAAVLAIGITCRDRRVTPWLLASLFPILVWCWRSVYLDTWLPSYTSGRSAADADVTGNILSLPTLLAEAIAPWWSPGDGNVREPLARAATAPLGGFARGAIALLVAAALLLALRPASRRVRSVVGVGFVTALVVGLPLTFLFRPDGIAAMSRSFYPVLAALAPALGLVVARGVAGLRRGAVRPFAAAAAVILVLVHVDALWTTVQSERAAAERIGAQLSALESSDHSGLRVVVGRELYRHGSVMLGNMVHLRLRRPFRADRLPLRAFDTVDELIASGLVLRHRGALLVYGYTDDAHHIRTLVRYPPFSDGPLPLLEPALGSGVQPQRDVATREVAALRVSAADPQPRRLEIVTERGTVMRDVPSGSGIVLLNEDLEWLLGGNLRKVVVRPDAAIELLRKPPSFDVMAPAEGHVWSGGPLSFTVGPPPSRRLRIHVRGALQGLRDPFIHYEFDVQTSGAPVTWRLDEAARARASMVGLSMSAIPDLFQRQAAPIGMTALQLEWRAEALGPRGGVVALSPWRTLVFKP